MNVPVFNPPAVVARPRARDLPYVKGCIESWAKWCRGGTAGEISPTGRLMSGARPPLCPGWVADFLMGRAHDPFCPQCDGRGRSNLHSKHRLAPRICPVCENHPQIVDGEVRRDLPRLFLGDVCFHCRGNGFVVIRLLHVNPVTIRSTRYVGRKPPADVCLLIEDLVTSWRESDKTIWLARVIKAEYFWNGDQDAKARELGVSVSFYEKRLRDAYYLFEQMLDEKMP